MNAINIMEKDIESAHFHFVLPIDINDSENLNHYLEKEKFIELPPASPLINHEIHTYSKRINLDIIFDHHLKIKLTTIELTVCPFQTGFLILKTEILKQPGITFSAALDFADFFRSIHTEKVCLHTINLGNHSYTASLELINTILYPSLCTIIGWKIQTKSTMFSQSLFLFPEGCTINVLDLFRSACLSGTNTKGTPYTKANNTSYIDTFVREYSYKRLFPNTCYIGSQEGFFCLTNEGNSNLNNLLITFSNEDYYLTLLSLFLNNIFIKITEEFAQINSVKDTKQIPVLTYMVNNFMAKYYYITVTCCMIENEKFMLFQKALYLDKLYSNTKEILSSLTTEEENKISNRDSFLLLILTVYTIFCGVLSINLFSDDLKGEINWSEFTSYNLFEYFAVLLVFSGIIVGFSLIITKLWQTLKDKLIN